MRRAPLICVLLSFAFQCLECLPQIKQDYSMIIQEPEEPVFVSEPMLALVNKGDTVRLPCIVDKLEGFVLLWKKKDVIITVGSQILNKANGRIKLEEEQNGNHLVISLAKETDAGEYTCVVSAYNPLELKHTVEIKGMKIVSAEEKTESRTVHKKMGHKAQSSTGMKILSAERKIESKIVHKEIESKTHLVRLGPISGEAPSFGQMFLEAVDSMNRTKWRYFLPEDTDIDQDGNLSDLEVQHKFNTYMGEVFKLIDGDGDNTIVEQELRSLKLDIPALTKVVDVALENFPLRPFFLAADANGDGDYDENDFSMPGEVSNETKWEFLRHGPQTEVGLRYDGEVWLRERSNVVFIGEDGYNEGAVICKSLGFAGLQRLRRLVGDGNVDNPLVYKCQGTETRLEDCPRDYSQASSSAASFGVVCEAADNLGPLRLVGGKDSSSGEIFFGDSALTCADWDEYDKIAQVVCRQLGFAGVVKTTTRSDFTKTKVPKNMRLQTRITCWGGDEKDVSDCALYEHPTVCNDPWSVGVMCMSSGRSQGLEELIRWDLYSDTWEWAGRFLFIADANGDGKVTLTEIASKGKKLLTSILDFLDSADDGKISLKDLTSPRISRSSIHDLTTELFDDLTLGNDRAEIDLYNLKLAGQDMAKIWGNTLTNLDENMDGKLSAADFYWRSKIKDRATFFIPILSQHLDRNQDGKIQREELREFTDTMFGYFDLDLDDHLTLEDGYSFMRKYGLDCFQLGALRSFVTVWLDTIETQMANFFGYVFKQYDLDGNGAIVQEELEKIGLPCHLERGNDRNRMSCQVMMDKFFGTPMRRLKFPDLEMKLRKPKDTIEEKMTVAACEVLTDYLNHNDL